MIRHGVIQHLNLKKDPIIHMCCASFMVFHILICFLSYSCKWKKKSSKTKRSETKATEETRFYKNKQKKANSQKRTQRRRGERTSSNKSSSSSSSSSRSSRSSRSRRTTPTPNKTDQKPTPLRGPYHRNQNPRCTPKPIYTPIFTHHISS